MIFKKGAYLQKLISAENEYIILSENCIVRTIPSSFTIEAIGEKDKIEAYSYNGTKEYPYFLAINWNPTLLEKKHPLSLKIVSSFLEKVDEQYFKNNSTLPFDVFMRKIYGNFFLYVVPIVLFAGLIVYIMYKY